MYSVRIQCCSDVCMCTMDGSCLQVSRTLCCALLHLLRKQSCQPGSTAPQGGLMLTGLRHPRSGTRVQTWDTAWAVAHIVLSEHQQLFALAWLLLCRRHSVRSTTTPLQSAPKGHIAPGNMMYSTRRRSAVTETRLPGAQMPSRRRTIKSRSVGLKLQQSYKGHHPHAASSAS